MVVDLEFEKPNQRNQGGHEALNLKEPMSPQIFKTIPASLNVVDRGYNILAIGGSITRTTQSHRNIIGKKCHKVFHKRESPCPWCSIDDVFKTGDTINEITTPDDPREKLAGHPLNIYLSPLRDQRGNITGVLELATDITQIRKAQEEQKQDRKALRESEQRYRTLVEVTSDIIFTVDLKGHFIFSNNAVETVLGYSKKEMEKINGFELVHPKDSETVRKRFADLTRGKVVQNLEYRYKTKNGAYIHILTNASPIFDSQGAVVAASGIARDVTPLKKIENALRHSEERYRSLYVSMKEGVAIHEVVYDEAGEAKDYIILDVNPSYEKILGLKKEKAVGQRASKLYGTGRPPYIDIYGKVAASRNPVSFDTYFPPMEKHFSISVFSPQESQFATVFTDITERKLAEEALQRLHADLEQQIRKRTADLVKTNEQLKKEIEERKQAEEALTEKEVELTNKAESLEEVNTALRVLLKRREEDKDELEQKVLSNVKDLVLPYSERLKKTSLDADQISCVSIMESNLNEVISPFSRKLSSNYLRLTPMEIRVADLVKNGKTTKEIAEFMNVSEKTIQTHRDNIRKKIGIKHKKTNLRSYLSSFQ